MKKTQDTMLEGRPYSLKIKDVISHIALANSEYPHPFYEERSAKKAYVTLKDKQARFL